MILITKHLLNQRHIPWKFKKEVLGLNMLKDIIETNRSIISKAFKLTLHNWLIIFTGLIYSIVFLLLIRVASMFWIFGGILIAIVQSAIISNYLYLIENIILYDRISIEDFKKGFKVYIWKVYGVLIVIWFANYGAGIFLRPLLNIRVGFLSLWTLIILGAFIFLNSLPEIIYQKHYDVGESFRYSFEFIKENWIDWFVPNIIFTILLLILFGGMNPINMLTRGTNLAQLNIFSYIIGQLLFSFIMIYRGLLFQVLSGTSRRKRMFLRNVYK